ncbi:hypothetical protein [Pontibacter chitinilyticus]|uniref:hypothetical protein n=1 Tax=Pontibacter chitinilyticus TaxID=2674989 RepID=UPI0032192C65
MKKVLLSAALILLFYSQSFAQGCVAIRSNGMMSCTLEHPADEAAAKGWQLNVAGRYFKSFRHFRGDEEQKERLEKHTEVINWQYSLDLTLLRQFDSRWSVGVGLPLLANKRSSLYEHGRQERHSSNSAGIGDMRIVGYRWLLNPLQTKGNVQLGVGVKLPTGNYRFEDTFYNVGPDGGTEQRPVDQSIQLGDGGIGAVTELNAFYTLGQFLSAYGNVYYLFNPRGQNGTRTYRETLSPMLANEAIMSVPDQYMVRLGVSHNFTGHLKGLVASVGGRMEGVPVEDVFGSSSGFRRPGYVQSLEPGVSYFVSKVNVFATVPMALKRNRLQSVTDKENSLATGKDVHGDAAFSDYAVNIGCAIKF